MNNQCRRIVDYLSEHGTITAQEAMNDLGIYRLAARMSDLKDLGFGVSKDMVKVKNRFGEDCHIARYKINVEFS